MLQDLVEFQFKAVNTQQTVTIIDAIHVAGVLHAITSRITRIVRVGKRMRYQRALPKARPNSAGPTYRRQRFPPYYMRRPYGRRPQYSNPPVQGEVMEVNVLLFTFNCCCVQTCVWLGFYTNVN